MFLFFGEFVVVCEGLWLVVVVRVVWLCVYYFGFVEVVLCGYVLY